jgi:hypothetical protein
VIDPVTAAYLAAGTVAGATLAPALLLIWLRHAIDRYAALKRDEEAAARILDAASERLLLEHHRPAIMVVRRQLEKLQEMGEPQS